MTTPSEAGSVFSRVLELVACREYDAARAALEAELWNSPDNPRLRQQLADVLALSGHVEEAADVLTALAESFAEKGQTAKAIGALKRVQVLAPERGDEHGRLARLLKSRDEERRAERRAEVFSPQRRPPAGEAPPPDEALIEAVFGEGTRATAAPAASAASAAPDAVDAAAAPAARRPDDPTTEVGILRDLPPGEILEPEAEHDPAARAAAQGSPLFSSFSAEELEAVIRGLQLLTFEPGDIVVTEGETGSSLFVLSTGTVKAFVKDGGGKNHRVRQLTEGSFFGEVSILTGRARSATIVAATPCELLELDRPTLDRILATHPRVLTVLQAFSAARVSSAAEALARRGE